MQRLTILRQHTIYSSYLVKYAIGASFFLSWMLTDLSCYRVEPVLYRRLTLQHAIIKVDFDLCRLERRNDAFFSRTVRELRMSTDLSSLSLLHLCTGITHLLLQVSGFAVLDNVPVYRFPNFRHLPSLRHLIVDEMSVAFKTQQVPRTITHLLLNALGPFTVYRGTLAAVLDGCPSLTHFMFVTEMEHQEERLHEALACLGNYPFLRCVAIVVSDIDADFEAMTRVLSEQHSGLAIINTGAPCAMDCVMDVDGSELKSFELWYEVEIFLARRRERARSAAREGNRA